MTRRPLFARKPLSAFGQTQSQSLKRSLGALDLTLLGIGCIMGTGIFVLSGRAAAINAGPAVMVSFVLAALCAGFGALCYAELAALLPVSGSAYADAYATLGECAAFFIGWNMILQYMGGAATVAVGVTGYLSKFIHHLTGHQLPSHLTQAPWAIEPVAGLVTTGAWVNVPSACALVTVAVLLSRGIRDSARFNAAIVAVKMAVVVAFLIVGVPHIDPANWQPFVPENTGTFGHFGISGVMQAATLLFFSYLGFDAVSVAAGETKNPQRDVPIGLTASLSICALLYIAVAAVLTGLVPYTSLNVDYPMALGVEATGAHWLSLAVDMGALAGLSSVLLVQIYAVSRILLAMAEDGFFPQSLTVLHPKHASPQRVTWLVTGVCAVAAALLPIDILAQLTSIGTLFVFATVGVGVMVLRVQQPNWPRRFSVPGGPFVVPSLCVVTSMGLMTTADAWTVFQLGVWMLIGLGVYVFVGRPRVAQVRAQMGYDS